MNNKYSDNKEIPLTQSKIDWRSILTPVVNQGPCGSCWAFSAIGALEANYNLKFNNPQRFSQQQLVDCDTSSSACKGGDETKALDYIKTNGIAFSKDYPYFSGKTNKAGTCKSSSVTLNKVLAGYEICPFRKCTRAKHRALLAKGPITVALDADGRDSSNDAYSIFQNYKSGVLDYACKEENHAVVMVGVDYDINGEYLIIRNSYGTSWGENGNFRFRTRDSDKTCFIETGGSLPIIDDS